MVVAEINEIWPELTIRNTSIARALGSPSDSFGCLVFGTAIFIILAKRIQVS